MTWKQMFTSSVGKKLVMGFTGIFLVLFLIVHVGLNACIWAMDNGVMFNKAAHFMGANVVPRILEIGLFAGFFLHIIQGYLLEMQNRKARGTAYAVSYGNKGSKWYSRSMALLGTLLLLFLIMHIKHFWVPSRITGLEPMMIDGKEYHNLYGEMLAVFENPVIVVLYVIGCISLAYHLAHGFQSAFRTIGINNPKYTTLLESVGYGFSIIVPLAFAMMPISMHLGWVN
ncbi:MAG: succinate dehydrogenase cytochrome b subunit [Chitinophagales bacterium]|jgi:succinate dehydrogenase / fumarate reductase cytochrome b subunit|nr:succinate dehydrogenase cytochrome b subunit [Chitinophagales bacterium]